MYVYVDYPDVSEKPDCIDFNRLRMTCTWSEPDVGIPTEYKLEYMTSKTLWLILYMLEYLTKLLTDFSCNKHKFCFDLTTCIADCSSEFNFSWGHSSNLSHQHIFIFSRRYQPCPVPSGNMCTWPPESFGISHSTTYALREQMNSDLKLTFGR